MADSARRRRALVALVPALVFMGLAVFLYRGLYLRPSEIPSPLIGKPAPTFELPPLPGLPGGLSRADLGGRVVLVSIFASWCGPCRIEHPLLMGLAERHRIPVYGIAYKDKPEDAKAWLAALGNPYEKIGLDLDGRTGFEWGVYGVPETFVIDRAGNIAHKFIGPLSPESVETELLPLVARLSQ